MECKGSAAAKQTGIKLFPKTGPALPPPMKLRPYGGIEMCALLLL